MRKDARVSKGWEERGSLVSPPRMPLALLFAVKFPLPLFFFFLPATQARKHYS